MFDTWYCQRCGYKLPPYLMANTANVPHCPACHAFHWATTPKPTASGASAPLAALTEHPCESCGSLREQLDAAQREVDSQMQSKLDAQMTLKAVTEALDLRFAELGNGWREAAPKILARIETIVDEADRAFRERDAARAALGVVGPPADTGSAQERRAPDGASKP